jgi:hypothetical protein
MRKPITILLPIAACSLLLGVGQAAGAAQHVNAAKTVRIVMSDPGCHWFSVGGKLKSTFSVKGPVALANFDEAALKIAGHGSVKHDAIGKKVTLVRGTYKITMVGQKSHDNTLKLVVT